jgi:hypothetical protein
MKRSPKERSFSRVEGIPVFEEMQRCSNKYISK